MNIKFENGSSIGTIESNGEIKRGKRRGIPMIGLFDYWNCHPSEYTYYVTGKRLPLLQRIWIDEILPLIKERKHI